MIEKNKKFYFVLIIIIISSFVIFSQDLAKKYSDEAKGFFITKEYDKAYNRIKFALRLYNNQNEIPNDLKFLAENIYYEYIKTFIERGDYTGLESIYTRDPNYTFISQNSTKIQSLKTHYETEKLNKKQQEDLNKKIEEELKKREEIEKIKIEKEKELESLKKTEESKYKVQMEKYLSQQENVLQRKNKEIESNQKKLYDLRENELKEFLKIQDKFEKERVDFAKQSNEDMNKLFELFITTKDKDSLNSKNTIITIVAIIVSVFGLIALGILFIVFAFIKNSQHQQRFFEYSLRSVQPPQSNILSLPISMQNIDTSKLLEDNLSKRLPSPANATDNNMTRLAKIIETCNAYSIKIDQITNRKNCSKTVAEIVYKISKNLIYSEFDCMLYYAASLIYDIGFLSIDTNLLGKPDISESEFEILKTHTSMGLNMIQFIDEDLKPVFIDAITMHHENLDGSGYPKGLSDSDISYIARVIRVAESYISLISMRKYKKIIDKESAIQILYDEGEKYDVKIVNILNNLV